MKHKPNHDDQMNKRLSFGIIENLGAVQKTKMFSQEREILKAFGFLWAAGKKKHKKFPKGDPILAWLYVGDKDQKQAVLDVMGALSIWHHKFEEANALTDELADPIFPDSGYSLTKVAKKPMAASFTIDDLPSNIPVAANQSIANSDENDVWDQNAINYIKMIDADRAAYMETISAHQSRLLCAAVDRVKHQFEGLA